MAPQIEDILRRRTDLSTFLVHLTRSHKGVSAKERLKTILKEECLRKGAPMGHAHRALAEAGVSVRSQRCVCFTETPLEHVCLLLEEIEGRECQFEPYGIAITKKQGRSEGVNPVWYVDITPGHRWLSNSINDMVDEAIRSGNFVGSHLARLTPFIEQMGAGKGPAGPYRKEFWWEREWRYVGIMPLPQRIIVLCPEAEHDELKEVIDDESDLRARLIDPRWSLEQIIARLAGFSREDAGPF